MSIHTFTVQLRSPGDGMFPMVEDGSVTQVEELARQAVADSGLLPEGCEVVMPSASAPPASPGV